MAITALFTPLAMNAQQYEEILRRLEAAGVGAPYGRRHHVCFGAGDRLRVLDTWDSQESFDAFAQTLMPIVQELGVDPGQPEIAEVHNLIAGRAYLDLSGIQIGNEPSNNRTIGRRLYEEIGRGNLDAFNELVAPDVIENEELPPGFTPDREGVKQFFAVLHTAFPDLRVEIEDEIAGADRVAYRVTFRGTHQGDFLGIPATGKQVAYGAIDILRFAGGKVVEHWGVADTLGLMQQLGAVPGAEAPTA
jgi:steroid delta-isomerase-like uncharacterized protein